MGLSESRAVRGSTGPPGGHNSGPDPVGLSDMAAGQAASLVDRRLLAIARVRTVQGSKGVSAVVKSELWLANRLSNR
jgi:hypothetical protein